MCENPSSCRHRHVHMHMYVCTHTLLLETTSHQNTPILTPTEQTLDTPVAGVSVPLVPVQVGSWPPLQACVHSGRLACQGRPPCPSVLISALTNRGVYR